ncbi:MAG: nucleotidyltransferase family protein [Bacteroidales bacterium]|jgi:molybdenum cofactor cytidylyltransferase|nr:nucleotidyltransferase family protein [Bacteroidales bacterium]
MSETTSGMNRIYAVILAAGASARMGSMKMLLPFGAMTIIEKVISNVLAAGLKNIIVVTGSGQEDIVRAIEKMPVEQCFNESWKDGMLSSVQCGIRALPEDCDAVLVCLGDQPMIDPATVMELIHAYSISDRNIFIPVYRKKRGHPLLIGKKYFSEIEKLDPEKGLRMLAHGFPDDVLEVETDNQSILKDIDTPEDYKNEINQTNQHGRKVEFYLKRGKDGSSD